MVPQNDSTTALSYASPTVPIYWTSLAERTRWENVHDVYWPDSRGGCNTGLLEGV